ncbi:MAG: hypothetical protein KA214_00740 [Neisseriaceae bacterium]|nr:hypothetical protein [Neisseriaceae bacterium]
MSLIDYYAPRFQFRETHKIHIFAPEAKIMNAILTHEATHDPLIQKMLSLRALPDRLWQKMGFQPNDEPPFGMDTFTVLGQDHHKELALGLIGKFWRPDFGLIRPGSAAAFHAFDKKGVAKLVMNYRLEPINPMKQEIRLTTETRIYCPDFASYLLCGGYWLLIRIGSGFIRRRILNNIKRQVEAV